MYTQPEIANIITRDLPDNDEELITAAMLRGVLNAMNNSYAFKDTAGLSIYPFTINPGMLDANLSITIQHALNADKVACFAFADGEEFGNEYFTSLMLNKDSNKLTFYEDIASAVTVFFLLLRNYSSGGGTVLLNKEGSTAFTLNTEWYWDTPSEVVSYASGVKLKCNGPSTSTGILFESLPNFVAGKKYKIVYNIAERIGFEGVFKGTLRLFIGNDVLLIDNTLGLKTVEYTLQNASGAKPMNYLDLMFEVDETIPEGQSNERWFTSITVSEIS